MTKPRIIIDQRSHRIDVFHYLGTNGKRYACPPKVDWVTIVEEGKLGEYERLFRSGYVTGPSHTGVDNRRTV